MLSKKMFEKYETHPRVKQITKKRSFAYLNDESKSQIFKIIGKIDEAKILDVPTTEKSLKIIDKMNHIEKVTLKVKRHEETINGNKFTLLSKRRTGNNITQAELIETKKMLYNSIKKNKLTNVKFGNVKIQNIEFKKGGVLFEYTLYYEINGVNKTRNLQTYGNNKVSGITNIKYTGENSDGSIEDFLNEHVESYLQSLYIRGVPEDYIKIDHVELNRAYYIDVDNNIIPREIEGMHLRGKSINLKGLFNSDKIDLNDSEINCVVNAFGKNNYFDKILKTRDFIEAQELYNYCVMKNISVVIYKINGEIIYTNKSTDKKMNCKYSVIYNEHCYILKDKFSNCIKAYDYDTITKKLMTKNEIDKKFNSLIDNDELPVEINIRSSEIRSFIHNDTLYFKNEHYEMCSRFLSKFYITPSINESFTTAMAKIIKKLDTKKEILKGSLFPFQASKRSYQYKSDIINYERQMTTIDANRLYARNLRDLPYLLYCNVMYAKVIKNPTEINDTYIYLVDGEDSIAFPTKKSLCWGYFLNEIKKRGGKFKVLEGIECFKKENHYTEIINKIFENEKGEDKDYIKFSKLVVNAHAGKLEISSMDEIKLSQTYQFIEKDIETSKTFQIKVGEDYKNFEEQYDENNSKYVSIFNNLPIRIQQMDLASLRIIEKIEKLGLSDDDIVKIKVDSITYYSNDKIKFTPDEYWKYENQTVEDIQKYTPSAYDSNELSFTSFDLFKENNNVIVQGYAGMGKSYKIMNDIIPKLNNDYIVLSPSHSTIKIYRKKKYNCDVIQKYVLSNTFPKEQNIIIDEFGLLDSVSWSWILKCCVLKKRIFCFGDDNQLKNPYNGMAVYENKKINELFLSIMFKTVINCKANWRNNITLKKYEKIIFGDYDMEDIENLVDKYCSSENPEIYIGYTKETCEKYNLKILEDKKMYSNGKFKNLKDVPVICKSNDYAKYGLYNNFECVIKNYNDKTVIIDYDDNLIEIKTNIFHKRFVFGYCVHLHSFQGKESKNIKWIDENKYLLRPEILYTLISRFQEDLNDKQKEFNKTQQYFINGIDTK